MGHPLLNKKYLSIYLVMWAVTITAHVAILYFYFDQSLYVTLTDSLSFNLLIGTIGYAFGFAFRYLSYGSSPIGTYSSYLALIVLGVLLVSNSSYYIVSILTSNDLAFMAFLDEAKIWRISAAAFYFSVIILSYYIIEYSDKLDEKENNEFRLENLLKQTELDALKSQINPHFIFNSLNSISSLTLTAPDKAQDMVIKLSNFLRYCLNNNSNQTTTLKTELDNINLYMAIEKVRFGDRLAVHYNIDETSERAHLPNLILQPLFENAIKYGVYGSLEAVDINVSTEIKEASLIIKISNSFDSEGQDKSGEKIGLKNTQDRLQLIYGHESLLTVNTEKNTFIVTLVIPQKSLST